MNRTMIRIVAAFGLLWAASALANDVQEVEWMDLMPEAEQKAWDEASNNVDHSGYASAEEFQSWETVGELDGQKLRIPGFVVPVETDGEGKLETFFLVPYFGACIHVPPPPANQIIYGRLEEPIEMVNIWDAFYMEGTLNIEEVSNETADSAYTMAVDSLKPYSG
ncbi:MULTISPECIES: DUF3299 domain-containing protein [unclassified Wenzhouxiangella]|uniref:DUF3299 domain-containing protein n=1 Tax=unclassified Wenzhouxiangella TaxID=2613841 RepID=UPI000E326C77|nr:MULTISPECIES: DUF3299 domain-containing protein [unclassified Wenzhouxiangella]RFF26789.1 DUF3299 domain-containing protein [Wenzhouxiangella sp. 15181]RFP67687.1 DUF3299 domain-containing protein [Wenzhouxiangella sp. 15190]